MTANSLSPATSFFDDVLAPDALRSPRVRQHGAVRSFDPAAEEGNTTSWEVDVVPAQRQKLRTLRAGRYGNGNDEMQQCVVLPRRQGHTLVSNHSQLPHRTATWAATRVATREELTEPTDDSLTGDLRP